VIDQNLKFFFGSLRGMPASKDRSMRMRGAFRKVVASRRGDDLLAACTQDRDVLDEALAAHVEMSGQFAAADRCPLVSHPCDYTAAPLVGGIKPHLWERFILR